MGLRCAEFGMGRMQTGSNNALGRPCPRLFAESFRGDRHENSSSRQWALPAAARSLRYGDLAERGRNDKYGQIYETILRDASLLRNAAKQGEATDVDVDSRKVARGIVRRLLGAGTLEDCGRRNRVQMGHVGCRAGSAPARSGSSRRRRPERRGSRRSAGTRFSATEFIVTSPGRRFAFNGERCLEMGTVKGAALRFRSV